MPESAGLSYDESPEARSVCGFTHEIIPSLGWIERRNNRSHRAAWTTDSEKLVRLSQSPRGLESPVGLAYYPATMKIHYQRFWCPLGTDLRHDGDGFVYDPEAEYGHAANPLLLFLVDWGDAPCLVLLGEPGMGKSTELVAEHERIQAAADPNATDVLTFNLNTYSSDSLLCSDIFESQTFKEWISSDRTLYLFLDSLDEGRLSGKPGVPRFEAFECPCCS